MKLLERACISQRLYSFLAVFEDRAELKGWLDDTQIGTLKTVVRLKVILENIKWQIIFFLASLTSIRLSYLFSIRRHQERRAILTPILTDFSVRITGAPAIIFTRIISPENLHTEVRARYQLEFSLSNGVLCLCRGEVTASACLTSN